MQKAADDMRKQQEQAAAEKTKAIDARVPKLDVDGLDTSAFDKWSLCYRLSSQSTQNYWVIFGDALSSQLVSPTSTLKNCL